MLTAHTFLFFLALLLVSVLLEPLAKKLHIPFSIILVIIGYSGSEIVIRFFEVDTGIRWDNFREIIFYVILPILIFQAAIEINLKSLINNLIPIFILALPLMVISAAVTAIGVYHGIAHPSGFPWIAALLTGALLSATDPAAVLSVLKESGASHRLTMLLEGESLFNDATAIVLFSIFIAMAVSDTQTSTWDSALKQFLLIFTGGLAIGVMVGIIGNFVNLRVHKPEVHVLVTLVCAYSSYMVAEVVFHFSGVMAVLSAGLIIGNQYKETGIRKENHFIDEFWSFASYVAEALIFLLAGITITLNMFVDQWLAIIIGIAAVILARIAVIFGFFPLVNLLPGVEPITFRHQSVLVWGGVRGTVTLALALSLPLSLDYWYTIQSIAYGVVLFTLFFQATTIRYFINRLNAV